MQLTTTHALLGMLFERNAILEQQIDELTKKLQEKEYKKESDDGQ